MIYYIPGTQPDHSETELEDARRERPNGAYRLRARAQKHDEVNRDSTRSTRTKKRIAHGIKKDEQGGLD